jgi:hypothetical protein
MRAHRLAELPLDGREHALAVIPDFDLYCLRQVTALSLDARDYKERIFDLQMTAVYERESETYAVTLVFEGIQSARLPELTPSFYLNELEIEDVSVDQLEGVRYSVVDYGMMEFKILCRDVAVKSCVLLD